MLRPVYACAAVSCVTDAGCVRPGRGELGERPARGGGGGPGAAAARQTVGGRLGPAARTRQHAGQAAPPPARCAADSARGRAGRAQASQLTAHDVLRTLPEDVRAVLRPSS